MKVENEELVSIAMNGFPEPCEFFVQNVCGHEHVPTFERLWDAFIQEETRRAAIAVKKD